MPRVAYQQPRASPVQITTHGQGYQNQRQNQPRPRNNLEIRNAPLDPIPMTYSQLLSYLIQSSLVEPKSLRPFLKPYPLGMIPMCNMGIMLDQ